MATPVALPQAATALKCDFHTTRRGHEGSRPEQPQTYNTRQVAEYNPDKPTPPFPSDRKQTKVPPFDLIFRHPIHTASVGTPFPYISASTRTPGWRRPGLNLPQLLHDVRQLGTTEARLTSLRQRHDVAITNAGTRAFLDRDRHGLDKNKMVGFALENDEGLLFLVAAVVGGSCQHAVRPGALLSLLRVDKKKMIRACVTPIKMRKA